MPRRRKNTAGPIQRRTTTGCQTCRGRKIKCDEAKPVCIQCNLKGLSCITKSNLKWEAEYLSKGLSFGRSGVWSKSPLRGSTSPSALSSIADLTSWCSFPHIHSYSFLNATIGIKQDLTTIQQRSEDTILPLTCPPTGSEGRSQICAKVTPYSPSQTPSHIGSSALFISGVPGFIFSQMSAETLPLLSYYVETVCPLTISSKASTSPFASLLIPFSVTSSKLVMDAMLALAACHLSRSQAAYKAKALQLSYQAVQTLRAKLRDGSPLDVAMNPETLTVMLLLCMFEIVNECDERWVVHLKGARDLLRVRREQPTTCRDSESHTLVRFCEHFFAFQDVMGRTACGETPIFGSEFWNTEQSHCDSWLGCSPALVSILSKITEMGRHSQQQRCTLHFRASVASLERQLAELKQNVVDTNDDTLIEVAELKRLAAELYLQCALNGAEPSIPWVADRVSKILHMIAGLVEKEVMSGIGWPLFVAAVELDPAHDYQLSWNTSGTPPHVRLFVLYVLDKLAGSLVNVVRTRSVIEKVWQARDLQQIMENESHERENDWEHFVAPLCGNMSLA